MIVKYAGLINTDSLGVPRASPDFIEGINKMRTLKSSIIETIRFENDDCKQGISISDAYAQARNQGFQISYQEYEKLFREIEKSYPCPSVAW